MKEVVPALGYSSVLRSLARHGLLLQQDKALTNVVALVAGETLQRSWWDHPRAQVIFRCLRELAEHPDVLTTKLVAGKVTFVQRQLWPALLGVVTTGEPWQVQGLSEESRKLRKQVERRGQLLTSGAAVKELEARLLVHAEQVHTEAGHHETSVESWQRWAGRAGCDQVLPPYEGRQQLEEAVRGIGGRGLELPWQHFPRSSRRARSS